MSIEERSSLIEFLRGELVGPLRDISANGSRPAHELKGAGPQVDHPCPGVPNARLFWNPEGPEGESQEVLSYRGATNPFKLYGIGVLYPAEVPSEEPEVVDDEGLSGKEQGDRDAAAKPTGDKDQATESAAQDADLDISNPDPHRPSTMSVTFRARLDENASLIVALPRRKKFFWQEAEQQPFLVNGRYERFHLRVPSAGRSEPLSIPVWRRLPAVAKDAEVSFSLADLASAHPWRDVTVAPGSPSDFGLKVELFSRLLDDGSWLVTAVLRNSSRPTNRDLALFQCYFELRIRNGEFLRYPESQRPFDELDQDEKSMQLLYRNSHCWAIGHACAAGWDSPDGATPSLINADAFPAVELPSMTADVSVDGETLSVSMEELASLADEIGKGAGWESLEKLATGYETWIRERRSEAALLSAKLAAVAGRHLDDCEACLRRMVRGLQLLKEDRAVRNAFRWANEAMMVQQVAAKQLLPRPLVLRNERAEPDGPHRNAIQILSAGEADRSLGKWRAFQVAFLLASIDGVADPGSVDRDLVDLVWFPTGGGKTEAYLGVAAFHLLHERLIWKSSDALRRDGTTVIMRYTLRMLTTDQFQRAAALVCALEVIRRRERNVLRGEAFRLGLWLGGAGSPNTVKKAIEEVREFARGKLEGGNPLVLTECPWCRAEIGRLDDSKRPKGTSEKAWKVICLGGISQESAIMRCPDLQCQFREAVPVEVIDERIYEKPPSFVIGTADKFAMLAYEPDAGALFGRMSHGASPALVYRPPSLIIQDELHLISGPLGTLFGLYEAAISELCTHEGAPPKIIASTATIRGADAQVRALFARPETALFPPPGLDIGDSFFGRYAVHEEGMRARGRLYLGIQAHFGSLQTTQQRTFSAALAKAGTFRDERKDAWWTLLAFYNSIRELSGAQTLFDSDIQSRLKHLSMREGIRRRNIFKEELTSRLSQAQIVALKNRLSTPIVTGDERTRVDACLASNIIEVGVDIERLSLMAVVGQPKSTASYIQVTGRVGRKWWERPGLILMLYNPNKSRDHSHFEQFHTYHRRLYERVEPTSATPFSVAALRRGLVGAAIAWLRQQNRSESPNDFESFIDDISRAEDLFVHRCKALSLNPNDEARSLAEIETLFASLRRIWKNCRPQIWSQWVLDDSSSVLMLVPGSFATRKQKANAFAVPTSLRQVDGQAELQIQAYDEDTA